MTNFPWFENDNDRSLDQRHWWRVENQSEPEDYTDLEYCIAKEPLLHEFRHNGDRIGIVTRNRYESMVLNSPAMLIADVDIGDPRLEDGCFVNDPKIALAALEEAIANVSVWAGKTCGPFYWLFKRGEMIKVLGQGEVLDHPGIPLVTDIEQSEAHEWAIARVGLDDEKEQFIESLFYGLGFRIYKTAGGLRYICTTHRFAAGMGIEDNLLRYIYSDPRYRHICKRQMTFRARLTPKPWRAKGLSNPRTCRFLGVRGSETILPEFQEMVNQHDFITGCQQPGVLA